MKFEDNVYALIKAVKQFQVYIEHIDPIWDIIFPDQKGKWHHVRISTYRDSYYLGMLDGPLCALEIKLSKSVVAMDSFARSWEDDGRHDLPRAWGGFVDDMHKWLKFVKKDWIKANKLAHTSYPLRNRKGIVPNSIIKASLPDLYHIDKELGKAKTKKFIKIAESRYFHDDKNTQRETMTAADYFDYCKISYLAAKEKDEVIDETMTGRAMYERFADGRHEGLLDIDMHSEEEFAQWLDGEHPKRDIGGHPWEIKRGGNTTHISLYVSRPRYREKQGFELSLCGASIRRLKETINMFLALYDAGLPITIAEPLEIRRRLLGQDNIGIVPAQDSLHRANQRYHKHEHVNDVLYYDDLGRYKRRINPFITWEPLMILKPI